MQWHLGSTVILRQTMRRWQHPARCQNEEPKLTGRLPLESAGPMLRAGFTDVPVMGIQTMCTNTGADPMAVRETGSDRSLLYTQYH